MGMRIHGNNSPVSSTPSTGVTQWQARQQQFKELNVSLKSGDLASEQTAFSALTQGRTPASDSPLAKVGLALQSGDLAAAQQAAEGIKAWRTAHHGGNGPTESIAPQASTPTPTPAGTGTVINLTA